MNGPSPTVLVVGAGGRLPGLVVTELASRGARVRGLVRDESRGMPVRERGASEIVVGDLHDPDSLEAAAQGVDAVFHIGPAFRPDEAQMGVNMVQAATRAGVRSFVFSAVIHPANGLSNHSSKLPVERALFASGMRFTILQPARLYQNIGRALARIRETGIYAEPYSNTAKLAWVDYRDVAEVAASALTEDRLANGAFELCAEGLIDRNHIAAVMSDVLGIPIDAVAPSFATWAAATTLPFDEQQIQRYGEMCAHYDEHGLPGNSLVLRTILGREPRTIRQYLEDLVGGVPTEAS